MNATLFRSSGLTPQATSATAGERASLWVESVIMDLQRMMIATTGRGPDIRSGPLQITSLQRGGRTSAVVVAGQIRGDGLRQIAGHFAGLMMGGTRFLTVDLSQVEPIERPLLDLMHRVAARMSRHGGSLELIGLEPPTLYTMDDGSLIEAFALYRAALEDTNPQAAVLASLFCPYGFEGVYEPGTPGRHRHWDTDRPTMRSGQ